MSDPSPEARDKRPSRISAFFRRKWSWKDIALIVLGLSFVSMAGYAFRGPISEALARFRAGAQRGETVSVFDVIVDRENRQYFDILFDKPLGQGEGGRAGRAAARRPDPPYPKHMDGTGLLTRGPRGSRTGTPVLSGGPWADAGRVPA